MLRFEHTVFIPASPAVTWNVLTDPDMMQCWLTESGDESPVRIVSDWHIGSEITFSGTWYGRAYESKGLILEFDPERAFAHTYWSSFSELPDEPEQYCSLRFALIPTNGGTQLSLTCSHCPTEAVFGHMRFYWATTLELIKAVTGKQH